jgi:hypothetical protein
MRRAKSVTVLFLAALSPAWIAAAAPAPGVPKGQMDEIFSLSGLEEQLELMGKGLGAALAPRLEGMPDPQRQALERALLAEFSSETLQRGMEARLERIYDARLAEAVLAWLRSPIGRRITKLEISVAGPQADAELRAYVQRAMQGDDGASAPRLALMQALDAATGMTEFTLEVTMATALATASGINGTLPAAERRDADELSRAVQAQRETLRSQIEQMTRISMLFTYRELDDTEIGQYIAFARSEAGRWYQDAVKRALLDVLVDASERVGRRVALELREAGAQPASPAH